MRNAAQLSTAVATASSAQPVALLQVLVEEEVEPRFVDGLLGQAQTRLGEPWAPEWANDSTGFFGGDTR